VVLFHGQVLGVTGGFLGVSVFFTLSGYLITTIAFLGLREVDVFDSRDFMARRARRLLPAASAGIVLAVAVTLWIGDAEALQRLVPDAVWSLLQLSNWHFIATGQDYAALFSAPSAFDHYWSLSIEAQFYVVFAVVLVAATRRRLVRPTSVMAVAGAGWAIALITQVSGVFTASEIYLSTITRSGEILAGVALAGALADPSWNRRLVGPTGGRARAAGVIGVVVVVAGWFLVDDPSGWVTQGGLALYAVASAAVVLAALGSDGVVVLLCDNRPMQLLGRLSYGLYVVHWPIFLLVDHLIDAEGVGTFVVQFAVSLLAAWLSWTLIETRAVRHDPSSPRASGNRASGNRASGNRVSGNRVMVATLAVSVLAIGAGAIAVDRRDTDETTFAEAESVLEGALEGAADGEADDQAPGPDGDRVPRLVVLGDSTALRTAEGMGPVLFSQGLALPMGGDVELGCGFARVEYSIRDGDLRTNPRRCNWTRRYRTLVDTVDPDVVVVQYGPWEIEEQILYGEDRARHLGDPDFDDFVRRELDDLTALLSRQGARVIWLDLPDAGGAAYESSLAGITPEEFEARRARWNELLQELSQRHDGTVGVIEISEWIDTRRDDLELREDGMHLTPDGGRRLAEEFLVDELVAMMDRLEVTT
jgi:peptidoglycan/LPS O-acetylase OafA/YrhL